MKVNENYKCYLNISEIKNALQKECTDFGMGIAKQVPMRVSIFGLILRRTYIKIRTIFYISKYLKLFLPMTPGSYYKKNNVEQMIERYQKYGWIVKECPVPGFDVIWLYDPDDIAYVYRNEDKYPERPGLDCMIHQRKTKGLPVGMANR